MSAAVAPVFTISLYSFGSGGGCDAFLGRVRHVIGDENPTGDQTSAIDSEQAMPKISTSDEPNQSHVSQGSISHSQPTR